MAHGRRQQRVGRTVDAHERAVAVERHVFLVDLAAAHQRHELTEDDLQLPRRVAQGLDAGRLSAHGFRANALRLLRAK